MRILVAMDKFRGTLTAADACAAVAGVLAGHVTQSLALSDGGEGFVDAFGGPNRWATVTGPQGSSVRAGWRWDGGRAVIESAAACGIALTTAPLDALMATSRGVGELIDHALREGAQEILVGVGGTACTDGGRGALEALAGRWDAAEASKPSGDTQALTALGPGLQLTVLVDVTTRFTDAARVFGPQKGATPTDVATLTERLGGLARNYAARFGRRIDLLDGSGAGGGLAGGLAAIGGELRSGFSTVATELHLDEAISHADLVITGEGRFDTQSLRGKVVGGVLDLAHAHAVPAIVIAGDTQADLPLPDDVRAYSLTQEFGEDRAWHHAAEALAELAAAVLPAS